MAAAWRRPTATAPHRPARGAAQRFMAEGKKAQPPETHLRADQSVAYRAVAEALADASKPERP